MDSISRIFYCFMLLLLLPLFSHAADADPLQDFCVAELEAEPFLNGFPCKQASQVTSDDFFFDGLAKEANTNNTFGSVVTPGNVLTFPGVNTLGLSMNRVDFAPGGLNPPHSHPRATESVLVVKGRLLVAFLDTNNKYYSKVVKPGEMFVIPRGLVHFQLNVGKGKALSFTAFNSQLPGAVVLPRTIFASNPSIPEEVLTKGFKVDSEVIKSIRAKLSA